MEKKNWKKDVRYSHGTPGKEDRHGMIKEKKVMIEEKMLALCFGSDMIIRRRMSRVETHSSSEMKTCYPNESVD